MNHYEEDSQSRTMFQDTSLIVGAAFIVITLIFVVFQRLESIEIPIAVKKQQVYNILGEIRASYRLIGRAESLYDDRNIRSRFPIFNEILNLGKNPGMGGCHVFYPLRVSEKMYCVLPIDTVTINELKELRIFLLTDSSCYLYEMKIGGKKDEYLKLENFIIYTLIEGRISTLHLGTGNEKRRGLQRGLTGLINDDLSILRNITIDNLKGIRG